MTNLRKYVEDKLDKLERLVPYNACLELDYDSEEDVWYAFYYREDHECSYPITINNKNVIAFEGMDHDVLVSILDDIDIFYVA